MWHVVLMATDALHSLPRWLSASSACCRRRARHRLRKLNPSRTRRGRKPVRKTTAGSRCPRAFAQPCSRTISATPGIWWSRRTAWSTSTPGAAAITATTRRPPADSWLRCRTPTATAGPMSIIRFGEAREQGNAGGTGIALYNGALYAETNDRIVRYALPAGAVAPSGPPEVIVSGLPLTGDHPMHPFGIDAQGGLYVDLGSATNSCQVENRMPNSPGIQPCTELETRAGIWRYDANRTGQRFSPAERFVTGLRNGEGIAFDSAGRMFATQHGRDQLRENWPSLYTPQQGADEPAEELVQLEHGADYGWPYCYFDLTPAQARPRSGIRRRRRQDGRTVRRQASPGRGLSRALGAQRPADLRWDSSSRLPTGAARSSPSTARGTARRSRRAATTWCSSRSRTARPPGRYVVFADGFAGAIEGAGSGGASAVGARGRTRTARSTSRTTSAGASGASPTAVPRRRRLRPHLRHPREPTMSAAAAAVPPEGIHPDAGAQAARRPADAARSDAR